LQASRYKGAYGGRGGAKSHFYAEQCVVRCLTEKTRIVCIREVQNSIKDSVKLLIEDKIRSLGVESMFTIMQDEIRGHNGSVIIFKGMQTYNADNIKSLEGYDLAWVEEAQTFSQHSLDLLRPTIRKPGSEMWFSWNPRYKTDAVDRFFRDSPPDNAISVRIGWQDNPWFRDTELYDDMLADYLNDEDKADHVWGGEYGQSQGAILAKHVNKAARDGRISDEIVPDVKGSPIFVSSDIGFRDTASWWFWQPLLGGFNILKYDHDTGLDADDWIPRIQSVLGTLDCKLGRIWLPHDARAKTFQSRHTTQEKFIKGFGGDKIGIVPQTSKQDRIEAARDVIKRCAFHEHECEAGLDGLRAWEYEYNDDSGVFSRDPKHNWASHPSDAFSYGCQIVAEKLPDEPEADKAKFFEEQTLDELWTSQPKASQRI